MALFIGLISGTSMDGIDAALVDFAPDKAEMVAYQQFPLADELRDELRFVYEKPKNATPEHIARLDVRVGRLFAEAAAELIRQHGATSDMVRAIGSHGQTILHRPGGSEPFTLQIGDPNIIAELTGITTIADFRRMDVAARGQGAPLTPGFHAHQFHSDEVDRIVLNIGGIANITVLPADPASPISGFDTGPGNALLDDWCHRHHNTPIDRNGEWAKSGAVDQALLAKLLSDPYFHLAPPKSTGRDYFNLTWLDKRLADITSNIYAENVQATLVQLAASSIAHAITAHAPATKQILVCGGGVHNPILMQAIAYQLPACTVGSTSEYGLDPDCVEAVTFAWLAKQRLDAQPANVPSVTGAHRAVVLGGVYDARKR